MKKILLKYFITSIISLVFIFLICLSKGIFGQSSNKEIMKILTDSFFAIGVVVLGFGLLVFASNGGAFDMLFYGTAKFINLFRRNYNKEKYKTFYDYRLIRSKDKNPYLFLILIGIVLILISLLFLWFYYQY